TQTTTMAHGVVLLPKPFNHPIRVAERAAALDIVSKGRLEMGTGRSTLYEQDGFNVPPEESRQMWLEAIQLLPKMWTQETTAHEGKYWQFKERNVLPKPMQEPHPPLWVAGTSEDTYNLAGSLGIGILSFTIFVSLDVLTRRVSNYKAGLKDAKPVGHFINDRVAAYTLVHCAENRQKASH